MILSQKQIVPILDELLQTAWQEHQKQLPLEHGHIKPAQLAQFEHNCHDLATIVNNLQLLLSLPADTTYYIKWQVTILEEQLPEVDLHIRPITPASHHPLTISPHLLALFTDYFIKVGRIPNPWLIS
ncbi:hypothetical protein EAI26_10665 [Lactobacillus sp. 0.1XD8-4]|nr:hypothetical protein [Lactobacillus sp. 0.1XD8-4]